MAKPFDLPKQKRIKKNKVFETLLQQGKRGENAFLILYSMPNNLNYNRVALRTSKKLGKAVDRNRLRRRLKELFRTHQNLFAPGHDILIIPKVKSLNGKHEELRRDLLQLMEKEDLLAESDCSYAPQIL